MYIKFFSASLGVFYEVYVKIAAICTSASKVHSQSNAILPNKVNDQVKDQVCKNLSASRKATEKLLQCI